MLSERARRLLSCDGFLGDGVTEGGLWFLGFRGGGKTDPGPSLTPDSSSPKWWQPTGKEDLTSRSMISLFESMFAAAISKTGKNAVHYENENLWRTGSGTAHINLFPIEGPRTTEHSDDQCRKYGFESNERYQKEVRTVRFREIRNDIKSKNPAAIICFGRHTWADAFKECLALESDAARSDDKGRFIIFDDRKILIMNHFANNWITQYDRLFVIKTFMEWKVQIP
jgi:hypothetical protein